MIVDAKFRGRWRNLEWLAVALQPVAASMARPHAVTWVPAHRPSRRHGGIDPGAMLARRLAEYLGVPLVRTLARADTQPQVSRGRAERQRGPRLVGYGKPLASMLVVDDVLTTGASLRAAAWTLRERGAVCVTAAVVAHAANSRPTRPPT